MEHNPLGKETEYDFHYDASRLFPFPRSPNRVALGIDATSFQGLDQWNAYELSWLNSKGKPEVRIARIVYSAHSEFIVESKSLKLYLNGFIMTPFSSEEEVTHRIEEDLRGILNSPMVKVDLYPLSQDPFPLVPLKGKLLDGLDISMDAYEPDPHLLKLDGPCDSTEERFSHLLKSNCPITGQPDWATVYIKYKAPNKLDDESLLKYIVSYRNHQGYHEACCEQIFSDLYSLLRPELLTVNCFFTRRGGIDINPMRSIGEEPAPLEHRFYRQ